MCAKEEALVEFRVLGPLEVCTDDGPLPLGGAKQRALLAILLLRRGESVSSGRLVDDLWGERPPATAVQTVQVYVSRLRKTLGDGVLVSTPGGYVLRLEPGSLDAEEFERLLDEGRELLAAGRAQEADEVLRRGLGLWRGQALADLRYEPFARDAIGRLDELRLLALELRFEADLALGRQAEAVPELEALVREHPLRERLRGLLMLALYRSGRQTDALASYRDARAALDELGLEPGADLGRLQRQILAHDPALEPAPGSTGDPEAVAAAAAGQPQNAAKPFARRRRWPVVVAVGVVFCAVAAVGMGVDVGDGRLGPPTLLRIDPQTDRIVAQVRDAHLGAPFGANLWAVAGTLWEQSGIDGKTIDIRSLKSGRLLRTVALPHDVFPFANGFAIGFGAVWALDPGIVISAAPTASAVERIDELSGRVVARIPIRGDTRNGVIAAGDGAVWVLDQSGTLDRIDPATNRVTRRVATGAPGTDDAVPKGGYVWIPQFAGHALIRYDERTGATRTFRYDTPRWPLAGVDEPVAWTLIVGLEPRHGTLWVLNAPADELIPLSLETGYEVGDAIGLGGHPSQAVLADRSIWVAAGNIVVRLVLASGARETIPLPSGMNATGLAVDSVTGTVWVDNSVAIHPAGTG
jgi:DNA-binding SARP family transcriptional activator/streptogramin lyase